MKSLSKYALAIAFAFFAFSGVAFANATTVRPLPVNYYTFKKGDSFSSICQFLAVNKLFPEGVTGRNCDKVEQEANLPGSSRAEWDAYARKAQAGHAYLVPVDRFKLGQYVARKESQATIADLTSRLKAAAEEKERLGASNQMLLTDNQNFRKEIDTLKVRLAEATPKVVVPQPTPAASQQVVPNSYQTGVTSTATVQDFFSGIFPNTTQTFWGGAVLLLVALFCLLVARRGGKPREKINLAPMGASA